MSDEQRRKYNWPEFCKFADDEGISLEDLGDYEPWWMCWMLAQDNKKETINKVLHCKVCNSKGFKPSITGNGCTFCDGTEGGNPPEKETNNV